MKTKKAISLIVLVITIIVMIILAGTVVLSLNNSEIIGKAKETVDKTNEVSVREFAQMIWSEAYLSTDKSQEEIEEYILKKFEEQKINKDEYAIKVTPNGVSVVKSVIEIVDTVPIPKGFVASSVKGENTKKGGLVIYEGTEPVTDKNVEDAKRNRNQYVWVPVENFNSFLRDTVDSTLYSNVLGENVWEVVLDLATNMPDIEKNKTYFQYITATTLEEVQEMYESVKEYKGFYIARYEAGVDVGSQKKDKDGTIIKSVHSKMNKAPYNYVRWTYNNAMNEDTNGAVEIARSIYSAHNENYGVVSTLMYGVQWDRTLAWWIETKAQNGTEDITIDSKDDLINSTLYGNYNNNEIANETFNRGASVSKDNGKVYTPIDTSYYKKSDDQHLLTTGATEKTRVNNIYDMAGNLWEWTMEGGTNAGRVGRGGDYGYDGDDYPIMFRAYSTPDYESMLIGFRPALYIKK